MVIATLDNDIVVLYDRLHKFYVDYIRLLDVNPTGQGEEYIENLFGVMNSVNKCMLEMAFGGMGAFSFLDNVNLTELYSTIFLIASEVHNIDIREPQYPFELQQHIDRIQRDVDEVYAAVQDVMQIFINCFNR